jgi:hypothetical protein
MSPVIRRAQTIDDLFDRDVAPDWLDTKTAALASVR